MKCKFCSEELPEQAEICPACGLPVRSNQQNAEDFSGQPVAAAEEPTVKKCKFCSEILSEGAEACPACGLPVRSSQQTAAKFSGQPASVYRAPETIKDTDTVVEVVSNEARYARIEQKSRKTRRIVSLCTVLVVAALVTVFCVFFTGYRTAIRRYVSGRESLSGFRYTAIVPDAFLEHLEETYSMNRKEIRSCLDNYFTFAVSQMEEQLGSSISFAYERKGETIYTDSATLEEYESNIAEAYDTDVDIEKAVLASIRLSMSGDTGSTKDSMTMTLLKEDGGGWFCLEAMEQVEYACEYEGYDLW